MKRTLVHATRVEWTLFFGGMFLIFFGHWAAEDAKHHVDEWLQDFPLLRLAFYIAGMFLVALLIFGMSRRLARPQTRTLKAERRPQRRENLALFLSVLFPRPDWKAGVPPGINLTGNLDADIEHMTALKQADNNPVRWLWEMPFCAIRQHRGKLKELFVICSRESMQQAGWFIALLRRYQDTDLKGVQCWFLVRDDQEPFHDVASLDSPANLAIASRIGWDFENFDQLIDAMHLLIKRLRGLGVDDDEIMIDFTGGQKPTSVAAVVTTINTGINAQYVETEAPWDVIGYDLLMTQPHHGLGH